MMARPRASTRCPAVLGRCVRAAGMSHRCGQWLPRRAGSRGAVDFFKLLDIRGRRERRAALQSTLMVLDAAGAGGRIAMRPRAFDRVRSGRPQSRHAGQHAQPIFLLLIRVKRFCRESSDIECSPGVHGPIHRDGVANRGHGDVDTASITVQPGSARGRRSEAQT